MVHETRIQKQEQAVRSKVSCLGEERILKKEFLKETK